MREIASTQERDKIQFFPEQVEWLKEMFPVRVLPVTATENEIRDYFGTQRVVREVESRVRR